MSTAVESIPPPAQVVEALGAAEDVGTLDRLQLLNTAVRLFGHVPTVARAGTKLAGELAKVAVGRSDVEAERRDWRFKDPTWTTNSGYHRLMQGYWRRARRSASPEPELHPNRRHHENCDRTT